MQLKLIVPVALASVAMAAPTDKHGLTQPGDQSRTLQDYSYQGLPQDVAAVPLEQQQEEKKDGKNNFWDSIVDALEQLGQLQNRESYYANSDAGYDDYYNQAYYNNNDLSDYRAEPQQAQPQPRGYTFNPPRRNY